MMNGNVVIEVRDKLIQELRRGILVIGVLSQLNEPRYGYSLMEQLREKGLEVEQGTLYPLLRRLEDQGLLQSEWDVEGSRPRRYYMLSPIGVEILGSLTDHWYSLVEVMNGLLSGKKGGK